MKKKTLVAVLLILLLLFALAGCKDTTPAVTTGIIEDTQFGSIHTELTVDEFCDSGFTFGDSIDIAFDNGFSVKDVPFYNGYYAKMGSILACGYPGHEHVAIARAQGGSLWKETGVTEKNKVTITLHEKGKYLSVQETLGVECSNDYEDYDSEEEFTNFREIVGGKLKEKTFYRSGSPCDNSKNRAAQTDDLAKKTGIKYVINLSDSKEDLLEFAKSKDFDSQYYMSLYEAGNVDLLDLNVNYRSEEYAKAVAGALAKMCNNEGPVLIHCQAGKDRTGFVCTLILALAGADEEEMKTDYMLTYKNYYDISKEDTPEKYNAAIETYFDDFLQCIADLDAKAASTKTDLTDDAEAYLRFGGLTNEQIGEVVNYISE